MEDVDKQSADFVNLAVLDVARNAHERGSKGFAVLFGAFDISVRLCPKGLLHFTEDMHE